MQELSDRAIIKDIKRVAEELGRAPSSREYNKHGKYGESTIREKHHFGTWNDALRACGLEIVEPIQKPPREELVRKYYQGSLISEIADEYDVARTTVDNWMEFYDIPILSKSPGVRKAMYDGEAPVEDYNMSSDTRRKYGILKEDDAYVFEPEYIPIPELREMLMETDVRDLLHQ